MNKEIVVLLHNIRSVHNVGSIFRTCDAAGVSKIFCTGYTPTPIDRFGRPRRDFIKVSLGAEKNVSWDKRSNIKSLMGKLAGDEFELVGVEQSNDSTDYKRHRLSLKTAFIFGNEVQGLSGAVLMACDRLIEIPMLGDKESLNVSVAVGVVLFGVQELVGD